MAYAYQQNGYEGASEGYVKYNISPSFSTVLGLGDTFTISGQAYWRDAAIKSIEVDMGIGIDYGDSLIQPVFLGEINKSISKGKTGTFSITLTIPQALINEGIADASGLFGGYFTFSFWNASNGIETVPNSAQKFNIIKQRRAPAISTVTAIDSHDPISGTDTPLDFFGGYIAGQSLPTLTAAFATDSRDTKLTSTHHLTVMDSNQSVIFDDTQTAAALATSFTFNLPTITSAGTYTWTWAITDSAGMSASPRTGTFTVLAYSPPSIPAFTLTRYRHDSVADEDIVDAAGDRLWLDLDGSVASVANKNAWTLQLNYGEVDGGTATLITFDSGSDGQTLDYNEDKRLYNSRGLTFSASSAWAVTAILTDMFGESLAVSVDFTVPKAGAYFNIEKTGVAVGMRSTSDAEHKKFEVADDYESDFYGSAVFHNDISIAENGLFRWLTFTGTFSSSSTAVHSLSGTLTHPDYAALKAAGYRILAIGGFGSGSTGWFVRQISNDANGITMNLTYRTGDASKPSMNPWAWVCLVKMTS